jgi:hypothetical protein
LDAVDPSADSFGAALRALVPKRVAQGLDGLGRQDGEAVTVQEGVELDQRERAVSPEQGERDRSETTPPDPVRVLDHRREGSAVERRGPTASFPCQRRVEAVAEVVESMSELAALSAELVELAVDRVDLAEQIVAEELQLESSAAVEAGPHAVHEHAVAEQLVQSVGVRVDHRDPRGREVRRTP